MENFWDYSVWGTFSVFAVLFASLLVGMWLKRAIPFLQNALIPTSVIGGVILVVIAAIYKAITGNVMFDTAFFGGDGTATLEVVTYHALALGFIASTLKKNENKVSRERAGEVFNTGVTTVATYLIQGIVGIAATMIAAQIIPGFFSAAGALLPFGYGQGTGQALNYGTLYETDFGFVGGKSFGLTIAALGFLSASIGGVIHLNIMRHKGKLRISTVRNDEPGGGDAPGEKDSSFSESLDKMTVQIALIAVVYFLTYAVMYLLGALIPGLRSVVYGFNFLFGVIMAILVKWLLKVMKDKSIIKKDYPDNFLLTRTSNFCFDVMIVSGIAAIRLDILERYWGIIILLGLLGTIVTYVYNRIIAKKFFPAYAEEQFLMMYGMLTGTASTGIILLREIDGEFKTPAADNMIYQNLPAIAFGFPMMILATMAPKVPLLTLVIMVVYFSVLNVILFRRQIFRSGKKKQ